MAQQTLGTMLIDIKGDTTQLIQGFNRAESAVNKTTKSMGNAINVLTGAFVSLQAIDLAKKYAKQVDELQSVNNRLKLVTKSNQEFLKVQNELFTQAQNTRSMYAGTIDLYGRIARSTQTLNLSQKELLKITDSVNKSMIIGGGSAESQQAALIQLGQAFSSNFKAVGQELGSIREQAPRLYEALIKGTVETNQEFKALVDNGAEASGMFKKWAEEGKLSSEIVINALKNQGVALDSEFDKMVMTIEQSMVTAKNSIQKLIYEFDQTSGVSKTVSDSIRDISKSIDTISPEKISEMVETFKDGAIAVGAMYGSVKVASAISSVYAWNTDRLNSYNKTSIDLEKAKAQAIYLSEKATIARTLADDAYNTKSAAGIALNNTQIQQLQKQAISLENQTRKQNAHVVSLEQTAKGYNLATMATNAFKSALASVPFMAISMAIGAVATSLLSASKASKTFEDAMNSTDEVLKEKTKNQLAYAKSVLATQIAEQKLAVERKKTELAHDEEFSPNKKYLLKSKADLDEEVKKLDEIKFKYEEIVDALNSKNEAVFQSLSSDNKSESSNKTKPFSDELQRILDESVLIKKKYAERRKELEESGQATAELRQKLNDEELKEIQALNKNEIKEAKKTSDEHKKILEDKQNQYINYYEKVKDFSKLWALEEQKIIEDNKYLKEDELNRLLEIEKQAFDKRNSIQQEYLSADEWRDYYLKIKEYDTAWLIEQSELYSKYGDSLGENFAHFLEIAKTEFYDKINEENSKLSDDFFKFKLEFDTNGLNDLGKSLYTVRDITEELGKEQKLYNDAMDEARKQGKDTAKIEEQHTKNQLIGYSNIAGAMSKMYEEGSKEAAAFQAIQTTLALIEATKAVIAQGSGDPYTAIPRMIAMAAMVSSLLGSVGIAFDMNKVSLSSDSYASMTANSGQGTITSDPTKASESITNSLDILKDFAEPQYQTLLSMNKYLAIMASSFNGISNMIVRSSGYALGEGFTSPKIADTGFGIKFQNTLDKLGEKDILGNALSKLTGGVIGGVDKLTSTLIGGLLGKTSVSIALTDAGMYFADQLLVNAKDNFYGSIYQVITKTTSKKSWFGSSSNSESFTIFNELYKGITSQFSKILSGMYDTVFEASKALDVSENEIFQKLDSFIVSMGKVSLNGKSGEEVSKILSSIFSKVGDQLAEYSFLGLDEFQQSGEGLFETLVRVAKGMEEAELYISKLGNTFLDVTYFDVQNKQGDVGFEALLKSIQRLEEATYPVNNNLLEIVNNLNLTAEELYTVYIGLDDLRSRLIFLGKEAQGLSSTMIFGAGNIGDLQKGFLSFFENFLSESEQLAYSTNQLLKEFDKIGIVAPVSKEAFKDLLESLDLTSESGQELYGKLIVLSETFADIAEQTAKSIEDLEKQLDELSTNGINEFTSGLETIFNALRSLKEIAISFIDSFSSSSLGNTRDQIKEYNKLRKQFNSFFDSTGNLSANVTEKEAKDVYSKLASLGTAIGKSNEDLQKDLVSQFENDLLKLDLSDQILKVDIVSGLADLLGLTAEQKNELQKVASDGVITNAELNNIKGLTEVQKKGILDFANNSSFFSTESTLSNLAEYSRLQLEALKRSQEEETKKLSKETLTAGNYIGIQEKIDLVNTLGMSFETAKPLIEKLQGLSKVNQKVASSELKNIIGFNGTSYDRNQLAQIERLNPYLSDNILNAISSIKNEGLINRNNAIANFYAQINNLANSLAPNEAAIRNKYQHQIDSLLNDIDILEMWKYGQSGETIMYLSINQDGMRSQIANLQYAMNNELASVIGGIQANIFDYKQQIAQMEKYTLQGYAVGAVNIPSDQIAQIHQGEMIIPKTFSEGLRSGELSLSATSPNVNFSNFNLMEGIKETMQDMFKSISEYPKKTHDLLDDVINGRAEMRVKTI